MHRQLFPEENLFGRMGEHSQWTRAAMVSVLQRDFHHKTMRGCNLYTVFQGRSIRLLIYRQGILLRRIMRRFHDNLFWYMCHRGNNNSSIKRDSRWNFFFGWTRNPSLWRNKIRRKNCWNGPFTSNCSDLSPTFHITSLIGPICNESQGFDRNDACARPVTLIWGKMIF